MEPHGGGRGAPDRSKLTTRGLHRMHTVRSFFNFRFASVQECRGRPRLAIPSLLLSPAQQRSLQFWRYRAGIERSSSEQGDDMMKMLTAAMLLATGLLMIDVSVPTL